MFLERNFKFVLNLYEYFSRGIRILVEKWKEKLNEIELKEFTVVFESAHASQITDQERYNKAVCIQKHWRGFMSRKRLKRSNAEFAQLKQVEEREQQKREQAKAHDELRFQLLLEHRRQQRHRKVQLMQIIEILPANQIETYFERQRIYSIQVIQAAFRGFIARRKLKQTRDQMLRVRAAISIQQAVSL